LPRPLTKAAKTTAGAFLRRNSRQRQHPLPDSEHAAIGKDAFSVRGNPRGAAQVPPEITTTKKRTGQDSPLYFGI